MGRRLLIALAILAAIPPVRALDGVTPCERRPYPGDGRRTAWCAEGAGWLVTVGPAFQRVNLADVFSLMDRLRLSPSCGKIQQRMFETQERGWVWYRAKIFADDFFRGSLGLVTASDTLWCAEWWVTRSPGECRIQAVEVGFLPDAVWKPPRARGAVASWIGFDRPVPPEDVLGVVLRGGVVAD